MYIFRKPQELYLPKYLIQNSGLNSGMMITQYTAASIVSQNKQYCTPSSVDSIVSSNIAHLVEKNEPSAKVITIINSSHIPF